MKKILLLLGNFTFHHFSDEELEQYFGGKDQIEDKPMCLVHKLDVIIVCESEDEAGEKGEDLLRGYESYLIVPTFTGKVAFENKEDEQMYRTALLKAVEDVNKALDEFKF